MRRFYAQAAEADERGGADARERAAAVVNMANVYLRLGDTQRALALVLPAYQARARPRTLACSISLSLSLSLSVSLSLSPSLALSLCLSLSLTLTHSLTHTSNTAPPHHP